MTDEEAIQKVERDLVVFEHHFGGSEHEPNAARYRRVLELAAKQQKATKQAGRLRVLGLTLLHNLAQVLAKLVVSPTGESYIPVSEDYMRHLAEVCRQAEKELK